MTTKSRPNRKVPIVQAEGVWRTYRPGTHQEVHALREVNLVIDQPSVVAIKGRSGSGKTTLLNCIGGLDKPTRGRISVFGQNLVEMDDQLLTQFRRKHVGFIFQSFGLNPSFSAYENVDIMLRMAGESNQVCRERTLFCLELVSLTKWRNHRPDELSGGQQQRIAIARALANHPRLILADEPTGDLDSTTTRDILTLFRRIAKEERVTLLISSHDPIVDLYSDRVVRLSDGMVEVEDRSGSGRGKRKTIPPA
jgi:putative ABC transport system ATP-binding protein